MQSDKPLPPAPTNLSEPILPPSPTTSNGLPSPTKTMAEPKRITITICGDGGTGKSSITLRLVRSQWTSEYDPTIEDSYSITRRIDGQTYHLSLTDTAGQEEYRGMWASSNLASDAFLMVYDITSLESLEALSEFNTMIDMESENRLEALGHSEAAQAKSRGERKQGAADGQKQAPLITMPVKIVAGNKCDLQESRVVTSKMGLDWARRNGCGFMETSARNTVNIEETFALIVRRVVEARRVAMVEAGLLPPQSQGYGSAAAAAAAMRRGLHPGAESLAVDSSSGGFGTGTRRAVTAPLSPLPVAEEKLGMNDEDDDELRTGSRPWWRRIFCCR